MHPIPPFLQLNHPSPQPGVPPHCTPSQNDLEQQQQQQHRRNSSSSTRRAWSSRPRMHEQYLLTAFASASTQQQQKQQHVGEEELKRHQQPKKPPAKPSRAVTSTTTTTPSTTGGSARMRRTVIGTTDTTAKTKQTALLPTLTMKNDDSSNNSSNWPATSRSHKPVLLVEIEANLRAKRHANLQPQERCQLYTSSLRTFAEHFPQYTDILFETADFFAGYFDECNGIFEGLKDAVVEAARAEYEDRIARPLREELAKSRTQMAAMESTVEELRSWRSEAVSHLNSEIDEYRSGIVRLRAKCEGENLDMTTLKGRLLLLHEQNDLLSQESESLRNHLKHQESTMEANRALVADNTRLQKEVQQLERRLEALESEREALRREADGHATIKRTKVDIYNRRIKAAETQCEELRAEVQRVMYKKERAEEKTAATEQAMRDMENRAYAIRSHNLTPRPEFDPAILSQLKINLELLHSKDPSKPKSRLAVEKLQAAFRDTFAKMETQQEEIARMKKFVNVTQEVVAVVAGPKRVLSATLSSSMAQQNTNRSIGYASALSNTLECIQDLDDDSTPEYLRTTKLEVPNEDWTCAATNIEAMNIAVMMASSAAATDADLLSAMTMRARAPTQDLATYAYNLVHFADSYSSHDGMCAFLIAAMSRQIPWRVYAVVAAVIEELKSAFIRLDKTNRMQLHLRTATQAINDVFARRSGTTQVDIMQLRFALYRDLGAMRNNFIIYNRLSAFYNVVAFVLVRQHLLFYDKVYNALTNTAVFRVGNPNNNNNNSTNSSQQPLGPDVATRSECIAALTQGSTTNMAEEVAVTYVDALFRAFPGDVAKLETLLPRVRNTFVPICKLDSIFVSPNAGPLSPEAPGLVVEGVPDEDSNNNNNNNNKLSSPQPPMASPSSMVLDSPRARRRPSVLEVI
eukprot:PhM_4_TR9841/c0_g1_i1/m.52972